MFVLEEDEHTNVPGLFPISLMRALKLSLHLFEDTMTRADDPTNRKWLLKPLPSGHCTYDVAEFNSMMSPWKMVAHWCTRMQLKGFPEGSNPFLVDNNNPLWTHSTTTQRPLCALLLSSAGGLEKGARWVLSAGQQGGI